MTGPRRRSLRSPWNLPGCRSEPTETRVTDSGTVRFTPGFLATAETDEERDRLAYLARVTEGMIGTLDTGESATRLAELAVSRLCDWALVVVGAEDGRPAEEGRAPREPALRRDVDTYRDGRVQVNRPDNPIAVALRTGRPVQLAPLDRYRILPTLPTDEVREAWERLDTTSAVIVPLR